MSCDIVILTAPLAYFVCGAACTRPSTTNDSVPPAAVPASASQSAAASVAWTSVV